MKAECRIVVLRQKAFIDHPRDWRYSTQAARHVFPPKAYWLALAMTRSR